MDSKLNVVGMIMFVVMYQFFILMFCLIPAAVWTVFDNDLAFAINRPNIANLPFISIWFFMYFVTLMTGLISPKLRLEGGHAAKTV